MNRRGGEEMGLRERKKLLTRRALSEAALRLAAERGLDNVLVEDIASAAGVSHRTFNNYFASKQEAIVGLVLARAAGLCDAVAAQPPDLPLWEVVADAAVSRVPGEETSESWRSAVRLIMETPALEAEQLRAYAGIERELTVVIAARTGRDPRADLYPGLAACAAVGAIRAALRHWLDAPRGTSYPDLLRAAFTAVGAGLADPGPLNRGGAAAI